MPDDHIKSEIASYLAGELPESRNRQIEAHAAACEKCRNAISKARSKAARTKREALKKASPDRSPNLFLARQGKLAGADAVVHRAPWVVAMVFLVGGGAYWAYQRKSLPVSHILPSESAATSKAPPEHAPATPEPPPTPPPVLPVKPKPPLVLHIFQDWKGPESGIQDSRLVVIRNEDTWQKLWVEMQSKDPLPPIDFTERIVLGVFAGERPVGTVITFGKIVEDEDVMKAPYRITSPAVEVSSSTAPAASVALAHPYLLAVVPRVEKKIRLIQKEN